jgi:hypothetical protein
MAEHGPSKSRCVVERPPEAAAQWRFRRFQELEHSFRPHLGHLNSTIIKPNLLVGADLSCFHPINAASKNC